MQISDTGEHQPEPLWMRQGEVQVALSDGHLSGGVVVSGESFGHGGLQHVVALRGQGDQECVAIGEVGFGKDKDLPHLEPWREFNRLVRDSQDIGIWHETYELSAGSFEAMYVNMPTFGLAAAGRPEPVNHASTAAKRLHRSGGGVDPAALPGSSN